MHSNKPTFRKKHYLNSHNKFKVAYHGLKIVFLEEDSFRYQLLILFFVVIGGLFFGLSLNEWLAITFAAVIVFSLEIINTAVENLVDLVSPNYNKAAGRVKDICAGAVLLSTFGAVVIGMIIFIPKILDLLNLKG